MNAQSGKKTNKVDPMAGAGGLWHCTARIDACMSGSPPRCCVLLPPAAQSVLQHKHALSRGHKEVSSMCVSTFGRAHWMEDNSG